MPDTERSTADLLALLANNTVGAISPQDVRDAVASCLGGYAGLILAIHVTPVVQGLTTSDQILTSYDLVSAQSIDLFTGGCAANVASGVITVGQGGIYNVGFFVSASIAVNNRIVHFTPYINNAIGLVEVDQRYGSSGDVTAVAMNAVVPYPAGAVVDIRARIASGTTDMTIEAMAFWLTRVG